MISSTGPNKLFLPVPNLGASIDREDGEHAPLAGSPIALEVLVKRTAEGRRRKQEQADGQSLSIGSIESVSDLRYEHSGVCAERAQRVQSRHLTRECDRESQDGRKVEDVKAGRIRS